jgi:hypothetical protein
MIGKSKAATVMVSVAESPSWEEQRRAELKFHMDDLSRELDACAERMKEFRERPALEREWHALEKRRDELLKQWNEALAENATLKT